MTTDPDAPLLAVLAAADRACPRVRRVDDDRAMVHAAYETPAPPDVDAEAIENTRHLRARIDRRSTRRDVAGVTD